MLSNNRLIALLYGWIAVFGIMLVASLLLSLLLRFTSMGSGALDWSTLLISLAALFIGGFTAGIKGKEKGWMLGGITGIGFILFVLLYQYLGHQTGISIEQLLHHVGFFLAALLGGMLGVNIGNPATRAPN